MLQNIEEMLQILTVEKLNVDVTKSYLNLGQCTGLHIAVQKSFPIVVKFLLENAANISLKTSEGGYTALHLAACNLNTDIVEMLLARKDVVVDQEDNIGFTPLLLATVYNRLPNMEMIIKAGADLTHAEQDGDTALHFAADKNNVEAANLLLEKGIDINTTDKHGWTALHIAAREGHREIVQFLIDRNIDIEKKESKGRTAREIALKYKKNMLVEYMDQIVEQHRELKHQPISSNVVMSTTSPPFTAIGGGGISSILPTSNPAVINISINTPPNSSTTNTLTPPPMTPVGTNSVLTTLDKADFEVLYRQNQEIIQQQKTIIQQNQEILKLLAINNNKNPTKGLT